MSNFAFVSSGWALSTYTVQLAEALAQRGHNVHFFCDSRKSNHNIDFKRIYFNQNLKLITFDLPFTPETLAENYNLFIQKTSDRILDYHKKHNYCLFIGLEIVGGAIANDLSVRSDKPFVYWSLEIFDKNDQQWSDGIVLPEFWICKEAAFLQSASATIIQDEDRGNELCRIADTRCINFIYHPLTISKKEIVSQKSYFLHDYLNLEHNIKILLQFGYNRMRSDTLIQIANAMPQDWKLVLNGHSLQALKNKLHHDRLAFSAERLSEECLPYIIASASAGLVHYENRHINDILTTHSSEKIARYLASGIPMICHDIGHYAEHFSRTGACITYKTPEQVGMAVRQIDREPGLYSKAASRAGQDYIFENIGTPLTTYIESFAQ